MIKYLVRMATVGAWMRHPRVEFTLTTSHRTVSGMEVEPPWNLSSYWFPWPGDPRATDSLSLHFPFILIFTDNRCLQHLGCTVFAKFETQLPFPLGITGAFDVPSVAGRLQQRWLVCSHGQKALCKGQEPFLLFSKYRQKVSKFQLLKPQMTRSQGTSLCTQRIL